MQSGATGFTTSTPGGTAPRGPRDVGTPPVAEVNPPVEERTIEADVHPQTGVIISEHQTAGSSLYRLRQGPLCIHSLLTQARFALFWFRISSKLLLTLGCRQTNG